MHLGQLVPCVVILLASVSAAPASITEETRIAQTQAAGVICDLCDINNGGCDENALCTCGTRIVSGQERRTIQCNCLSGFHGDGHTCNNEFASCRDNSDCWPQSQLYCQRDTLPLSTCRSSTVGVCRRNRCGREDNYCKTTGHGGEGEGEGERAHVALVDTTCEAVGVNAARCVPARSAGSCLSCECEREDGKCERVGINGRCKDSNGQCTTCTHGDRCSPQGLCVCGKKQQICSGLLSSCVEELCCSQTTCQSTDDCCGSTQCVNSECRPLDAVCNAGDCSNHGTATGLVPDCVCQCTSDWTGKYCRTPTNACLVNNGGCDVNALCTPTGMSRTCSCNAGYSGNGVTCADINECTTKNGGCSHYALCTNTPGSRTCACNCGFTDNGIGTVCTDINECALVENGGCGAHADCNNMPGFFTCVCQTGFAGDGYDCIPTAATLIVQVDDLSDIFTDGVFRGHTNGWDQPITLMLDPAPNIILVQGNNLSPGPHGIIASTNTGILSGTTWKCMKDWPAAALLSGYNFYAWPQAEAIFSNGEGAWGPSIADKAAKWIWYPNGDDVLHVTCVWTRVPQTPVLPTQLSLSCTHTVDTNLMGILVTGGGNPVAGMAVLNLVFTDTVASVCSTGCQNNWSCSGSGTTWSCSNTVSVLQGQYFPNFFVLDADLNSGCTVTVSVDPSSTILYDSWQSNMCTFPNPNN